MSTAQNNQTLIADHALQQTIGWISLLMPITVRLLAYLFYGIKGSNSISAYYYTSLRDVFVASLVAGGVVLFFWQAETPVDRLVVKIAGVAAAGIGLFPMNIAPGVIVSSQTTNPADETQLIAALQHGPHGPLGYHFLFVSVFFALACYLVTFRFRANTPRFPTRQKVQRNNLYVLFGFLMAIAFAWIGIIVLAGKHNSIFWPESLAVMAFAAAWLVKGQLVLKDRHQPGAERDNDAGDGGERHLKDAA